MTAFLTRTEGRIVRYLQSHPRLVSYEELMTEALGYEFAVGAGTLSRAHIANIRRKLGADCIHTIRGRGYRWAGARAEQPWRTDGWWSWPTTYMGLNEGLRGRVGEPLQVIARANTRSRGLALVRFKDGFECAAPAAAIHGYGSHAARMRRAS